VWGSGPTDVYAVGYSTGVLHWDGTRWSPTPPFDGRVNLHGVGGTGPDDVWIIGDSSKGGVLYHWDGQLWSSAPTGTALGLFSISGRGPRDVWAVGPEAAVIHLRP